MLLFLGQAANYLGQAEPCKAGHKTPLLGLFARLAGYGFATIGLHQN
jgi:hypothetical protein